MTALLEVSKKVTEDLKEIQKAIKKIAKDAPKEKKPAEKAKKAAPAAAGGGPEPEAEAEKVEKVEKKPKAKKAAPAAAGGPEPEKTDKRLTRMSGPTLKAFEKALGDKSADHKKKFMEHVNAMDADKFASMALEKHMEEYASTLSVQTLTIIQLRAQKKDLVEVSTGVYKNSKTGTLVTGPPEKEDEEFEDATLEGVNYVIGADTTRVHRATDDGPDGPFEGYWGVGKFLDADL